MKTSKIINEVGSSVEDAETVATVAATTLNSGPNKIDCKECISYENVKNNWYYIFSYENIMVHLFTIYDINY